MSMVLFASVVRVADGLPLSASTDCEQEKDLQETKRHLKGLSKKLNQFPDRGSVLLQTSLCLHSAEEISKI
uniref:Uncharacterized protein n=1 Tax=Poecilia latipinna TaxID=48699 RepID=A0A3B3VUF7_9TELE